MRIAHVFGSIPTRSNEETDFRRAVVEKKDWLGQEAEYVAKALERRHPGSAVSIHIMYPLNGRTESNGVEWIATRPPGFMLSRWFYQGKQWSGRFMREIHDWKPDLIHWQMNSYAYTFHLAARKMVKWGIPYVYQHHGAFLARKPWVRKVLQYPHDHAEKGIYSLPMYEEEYRKGLNLDPARSAIIPVGYDTMFCKMDREECRKKTGFEGSPTLFWCHGLTNRKDPLTVLRAYSQVVGDFPDSRMYMAGNGPIEDQVRAFINEKDLLRDRVKLLGWVNNRDVLPMANAADIFLMASRSEAYGIASMEAMACGAFPILPRIPSMIEQTENGDLGLLFEPGNVEECALALRKAMGDVEYREAVRARLPEAIKPRSWEQTAERLVDLYEDVLGV